MEKRDGQGPGDEQRSAKKRAPSARKRAPKAVNAAEQDGRTATEREVAPQTEVQPAQGAPADLGGVGERTFGERDSESPADVAADLKSWLDTRREDRDAPREVL